MSDRDDRLNWISETTAEKARDYIALSDHVWDLAELRFQEHQSVAAQIARCEAEGFHVTPVSPGCRRRSWRKPGSGLPILGFLGEYDALAGLSQEAGDVRRPRRLCLVAPARDVGTTSSGPDRCRPP